MYYVPGFDEAMEEVTANNLLWLPKCECGGDITYGKSADQQSCLHSFSCPKGRYLASIEQEGVLPGAANAVKK